MALAVDAACRNNETTATCATSRHLQHVKHTHKQVSAVKEGSMVPDASKTWNVPTCKQAGNLKQPRRIVRHMGSQKMVMERIIMLGKPEERMDACGTRAHMRRESELGLAGPSRARQGSRHSGWSASKEIWTPRACKQKL